MSAIIAADLGTYQRQRDKQYIRKEELDELGIKEWLLPESEEQHLYQVSLLVSSAYNETEVNAMITRILESAVEKGAPFNFSISCGKVE